MNKLIGVLILILMVVTVLDCLKQRMDPVKKLLWILLILLVPVAGMILYFLLGRGK